MTNDIEQNIKNKIKLTVLLQENRRFTTFSAFLYLIYIQSFMGRSSSRGINEIE